MDLDSLTYLHVLTKPHEASLCLAVPGVLVSLCLRPIRTPALGVELAVGLVKIPPSSTILLDTEH